MSVQPTRPIEGDDPGTDAPARDITMQLRGRSLPIARSSGRRLAQLTIAGGALWLANLGLVNLFRLGSDQYFPLIYQFGVNGSPWGSYWQVPPVPVLPGGFWGLPGLAAALIGFGAGWPALRHRALGTSPIGPLGGFILVVSAIGGVVSIASGFFAPVAVALMLELGWVILAGVGSAVLAVALLLRPGSARLPALLVLFGTLAFLPVDPGRIEPARVALQTGTLLAFGAGWLWLGVLALRHPVASSTFD